MQATNNTSAAPAKQKELYFLEFAYSPKNKEDYIGHIAGEVIVIPLAAAETYNDLFKKLLALKDPYVVIAAKKWIDFNKEEKEDLSAFDEEVNEYSCFAMFELLTF